MVLTPKVRGFICTTAHPVGCEQNVKNQIDYVKKNLKLTAPKKVLVIGSSTGYGLASRITAAFGSQADTLGVCFEKPASGKRTASAGWYNTAAFEKFAHQQDLYAKTINGDAFSDEIKQQVVDTIRQDWQGKIDLVIYSLASPRRIDSKTGDVYQSALKPVGSVYKDKTVNVMSGEVSQVEIAPASQDEIDQTTKVMGGEDWSDWIDVLADAHLLADDVKTVAYSYIGPDMTYPIYRHGTIGKAKEHLEQTASIIDDHLQERGNGHAYVSVNKGLVTQASSAIPVVPLYLSILYKEMKKSNIHEGCIEQIARLFNQRLYQNEQDIPVDKQGRIRIDDLEMREDIQQQVAAHWEQVTSDNLEQLSDIIGYRKEFYQLFGFEVPGVDYSQETNIDVAIPSLEKTTA